MRLPHSFIAWCSIVIILAAAGGHAAQKKKKSSRAARHVETVIESTVGNVLITIRNVDIARFPEISVIFDAYDRANRFVRTLRKNDLLIRENGIERPISSIELISNVNRIPVDIVFALDRTGSMGDKINEVRQNIEDFSLALASKGFDFRLGLIEFGDEIDVRHPFTTSIAEFKGWLGAIEAAGGGDEKENALEAFAAATTYPFRPIATRIVILISDAPYHQQGELGDGVTKYNTETASDKLIDDKVQVYAVTNPEYKGYHTIALATDGAVFPITENFSSILSSLTETITNLYALTFTSQSTLMPDSVRIEILRSQDRSPVSSRKLMVLDVGRRLVLDDLHYGPNQTSLKDEYIIELDRLVRLMNVRKTLKILIEGHADAVGDDAYNMKLSFDRAQAVKNYLVQSGIISDRIQVSGKGNHDPIATNDTESGRRMNRRTEFVIIEK